MSAETRTLPWLLVAVILAALAVGVALWTQRPEESAESFLDSIALDDGQYGIVTARHSAWRYVGASWTRVERPSMPTEPPVPPTQTCKNSKPCKPTQQMLRAHMPPHQMWPII